MSEDTEAPAPSVEEIVPSPSRTVSSLRDIGYETTQAVADLADNALNAGATRIDVTVSFSGAKSWIRVADDGAGMDAAAIHEAMRYGSERRYEANDLGKFGFGLKTASTSQCRRLTVASRRDGAGAPLEVRCLDLDHIEATNRWEVLVIDPAVAPDAATSPLAGSRGTVVLWEKLDRMASYKDPWGEWANRYLLSLADDLDQHLGMVFQRFMAGTVDSRPACAFSVNDAPVRPWDPFCIGESTRPLQPRYLPLGESLVRVCPYVLPRQNEFSSDAAWRRAKGPANWNRQQGFYVFRGERLIQSGGWNRIRTPDEHTKLARVSLDFPPALDTWFGINIAKAYVKFPAELREQLEQVVAQVTRAAEVRYRGSTVTSHGGASRAATRSRAGPTLPPAPAVGGSAAQWPVGTGPSSRPSPASPPLTLTEEPGAAAPRPGSARPALETAAATVGESRALARIVDALKSARPEVARELGW